MLGLIRAECYKMKHSFFYPMHILVPVASALVFLIYLLQAGYQPISEVSGYLQVVAMFFPFFISLVCAMSLEPEKEAGSYKELLGQPAGKVRCFLSKLAVLLLMGFLAEAAAVLIFLSIYQSASEEKILSVRNAVVVVCIIYVGQLFVYLFHIFLQIMFGKGAGILTGAFEGMIAAVFYLDIGVNRWRWFPCTYGGRFLKYYLADLGVGERVYTGDLKAGILTAVLFTAAGFVLSFFWFTRFSGNTGRE